jgi:hypothetical protein
LADAGTTSWLDVLDLSVVVPAFQTYVTVLGVGVQVPRDAVRVLPTLAVPLIVGVGATNTPTTLTPFVVDHFGAPGNA